MRGTFIKLHYWIGLAIGLVIAMWAVTGIVMGVVPEGARRKGPAPAPVDYSRVTVSPAAVAQSLLRAGLVTSVRSLTLQQLRGQPVYRAEADRGTVFLIDAQSGALLTISAQLAESLARTATQVEAPALSVDTITRRERNYNNGPLPAYRIVFGDDRETIAYVAAGDGTVQSSDRQFRFRLFMGRLHSFAVLRGAGQGPGLPRWTLLITALVTLAATVTGYYLVVVMWKRRVRPIRR